MKSVHKLLNQSVQIRVKTYTRFDHHYTQEELIHCDPYFQKGLKGFINRLTDDDQDSNQEKVVTDTIRQEKAKKKSKVRKFFEKIFGGKKKQ